MPILTYNIIIIENDNISTRHFSNEKTMRQIIIHI